MLTYRPNSCLNEWSWVLTSHRNQFIFGKNQISVAFANYSKKQKFETPIGLSNFAKYDDSMDSTNWTFQFPESADLVVASDIHIRGPEDPRAKTLILLIETACKMKVKNFILNGDIFDFFFGWTPFFENLYGDIFRKLKQLSDSGCNIDFIEGNHEFGMDRLKVNYLKTWDSFGKSIRIENTTIQIIHGDLMKYDWKYFAFRRIVRSNITNLIASLVPQSWLYHATLWFASTSRKKDKYRTLHHDRIIANAVDTLRKSSADHLIFGHFHHPYDETITDQGKSKRLISVDSWDRPSCIVFHERQFKRIYL